MAAVEPLLDRAVRSVRARLSHPRVWSLQELCRRCLVSARSLPEWKALTRNFAERVRRRACLFSIVHFSGCGVNFCLQRYFSESDHHSYWISCTLDRKSYMAVSEGRHFAVLPGDRASNRNADRLLEDDDLWHWARLDHPHVLSVLAVACNAPGVQVYLVTPSPDDGLEHFAGILAVRDLCVRELQLWKFLRQLCSALIYLRGPGGGAVRLLQRVPAPRRPGAQQRARVEPPPLRDHLAAGVAVVAAAAAGGRLRRRLRGRLDRRARGPRLLGRRGRGPARGPGRGRRRGPTLARFHFGRPPGRAPHLRRRAGRGAVLVRPAAGVHAGRDVPQSPARAGSGPGQGRRDVCVHGVAGRPLLKSRTLWSAIFV
ncbi:uncharacterized protein [Dermacentor albipictus]|uniref:uncharacterized protein isoform X2 n=1 Tax=Dermacentor albipictus TaxID=60249 RepID=UPI0031FD237F